MSATPRRGAARTKISSRLERRATAGLSRRTAVQPRAGPIAGRRFVHLGDDQPRARIAVEAEPRDQLFADFADAVASDDHRQMPSRNQGRTAYVICRPAPGSTAYVLRRRTNPTANSPMPVRSRVAGSGTGLEDEPADQENVAGSVPSLRLLWPVKFHTPGVLSNPVRCIVPVPDMTRYLV